MTCGSASKHDSGAAANTARLNLSRSQRIIWLLEELKLPYEVVVYHRNKETLLAPPELEKVHPLGKSPVIEVPSPDGKPIVIAESGFMTQYLVDHSPEGKNLVPAQWRDGMQGKMGGETPEWLRYQYYMHYAEGSIMPMLLVGLVCMREWQPFFSRITPVANVSRSQRSSGAVPGASHHRHHCEPRRVHVCHAESGQASQDAE